MALHWLPVQRPGSAGNGRNAAGWKVTRGTAPHRLVPAWKDSEWQEWNAAGRNVMGGTGREGAAGSLCNALHGRG